MPYKILMLILSLSLFLPVGASARVRFDECEWSGGLDRSTRARLFCTPLTVDENVAQAALLKKPYTAIDREIAYEGIEWQNDGETLTIGRGYLFYETHEGAAVAEIFDEPFPTTMTSGADKLAESLDFTPLARAQSETADILESLGIPVEAVAARTLDAGTLQQKYAQWLANDAGISNLEGENLGESRWTNEDACYVFFYRCVENGLPVATNGYFSDIQQTNFEGTTVTAIYGKSGVTYLHARGLYEIVETQADDRVMIDRKTSRAAIEGFYMFYEADIRFVRLQWVRVPILGKNPETQFELIPAWIFTQGKTYDLTAPGMTATGYGSGEEIPESATVFSDFAMIDARTGAEI